MYRAYTQCLASPARTCPLGIPAGDWFVLARACLATAGSWLARRLRRWFLLRPAASPLVLASSGGFAAGSCFIWRLRRWFLLRLAASPLVLASSGGFAAGSCFVRRLRRWSCFAAWSPLVLRLLAPLSLPAASPQVSCACLGRSLPHCHRSVFTRANSTGIRRLSSSSTLVVV